MAIADFFDIITTISLFWNTVIFISLAWLLVVIVLIVIFILISRKKTGVDVSALAALASSDPMSEDTAPNADPKEVMAILQIERVAASTALSAVKDARKSKRISSGVRDSLANRYKVRIAKIDTDLKRRSGAQEYKSLADSLEQSRDRLRGEVMPSTGQSTAPPPSSTPGIPSYAPPVPGVPSAPPSSTTPLSIPSIPSTGPPRGPSFGTPPTKPASPIPTPPRIPPVSASARPTTVVPPSVAPPTVSTPPLPPKLPSSSPVAPPTTSNMAPPPVPTSTPTAPTTAPVASTGDGDGQSISGLRMEMLRELARLKKFMSEETQD